MTQYKAKFRDELDRFSREYFNSGIATLKDKQRSDALTLCYAMQVRNALLPGSMPDDFDELQNHICDGASDRSVDFIYRDDNRHVTIIQTKHRTQEAREEESEFHNFRKCIEKLCPETRPNTKINQKVLDLIADIDWENDNFTLIFLSLARHSAPLAALADKDLDNVPNTSLKDLSDRSDVLYLSEDNVNMAWRDALGQLSGENPTVSLLLTPPNKDQKGDYFLFDSPSGVKSYICLLSSAQIHQTYNRYRDRLFNLNIRNYIGDTRTNKEIINTATKEPTNFFFYNNGISAVARSIRPNQLGTQTSLDCTDFSIINGAQTFRSISKAHTSDKKNEANGPVQVLVRITELDFRKADAGDRLDSITRYNNTQNSMRLSDFRSNDKVQSSIVKYMQQLPAFGGKHYIYRNKRTHGADRNKHVVKMDELCRSLHSYRFGPPDYFGGLSYLYDTSSEGGYVKIFGSELDALPQLEFDRAFGIWLITNFVASLLKDEKRELTELEEPDDSSSLRKYALERKYLVFFAVGEVFREICKLKATDEAKLLVAFSKPKWQGENNRVALVKEAYYLGCDLVVQAYQIAQSKPGFVHRNFFRDPQTLADIRSAKAGQRRAFVKLSEHVQQSANPK